MCSKYILICFKKNEMQIATFKSYTFKQFHLQTKKNKSHSSENNYVQNSTFTSDNVKANFIPVFTSLKQHADSEVLLIDTAFYRDLETLTGFAELMKKTFPEGADIMDFACSMGQEAISIHTLVNHKNNNKYKLYCYDVSDKAVKLADNNIHPVCSGAVDDFLINKPVDKQHKDIIKRFYELMEEIPAPDFEINNEAFMRSIRQKRGFNEKYFKIKDEYKEDFKFEKGDIRNILAIQPQKQAGAVFFRNALYHITNNHIFDRIYDRETLDKIWNTNKEEVILDVVDKVYEKLLPGGFLVLGNDVKDQLYQADKYTPQDEIYFDDFSDEYIRYKSPLEKALRKDGRFKPVVSSKCETSEMGSFTVHTVWQKQKNSSGVSNVSKFE